MLEKLLNGEVRQISIPIKVPDDYLERLTPQDAESITVFVQSNSKFKDKRDSGNTPRSSAELLGELNEKLNRQDNVLFVQQIMIRPKSIQEENKKKAESAGKPPLQWTILNQGELNQLPSNNNFQVTLSLTAPLDHYIDFEAVFGIEVKSKDGLEIGQLEGKKKRSKWFPFKFWH